LTAFDPAGHRLFARYAHAPNALGYCGPEGASAIREVASGKSSTDLSAIARRFSGAWPYQSTLATAAGIEDPMDERVVRGYWTGNDLTASVDPRSFGGALLDRIAPQAGHYWVHLDDSLVTEAAPTHAFHVLSVYPWSRLLPTGRTEPISVLDSCRVTPAVVESVEGDTALVRRRQLQYADGVLSLAEEDTTEVAWRRDGVAFIDEPAAGDTVAVHWGFACDALTTEQADSLAYWTAWQLDAIAPRLAAAHHGG
jgi:hydrogenase maturation factor